MPNTRSGDSHTASLQVVDQRTVPTGGASVLNRASALRDNVGFLHEDVADLHQAVRSKALDERTTIAAMRSANELLRELASERGLSWALIAKLAGVTPTAIRKWRRGEAITPENRRSLARVAVFLDMVAEATLPLADPASWLEMPLSDESTLTPTDLYAADRLESLLEVASARIGAHAALDEFDPNWRTTHARDDRFRVEEAADGGRSIVEQS